MKTRRAAGAMRGRQTRASRIASVRTNVTTWRCHGVTDSGAWNSSSREPIGSMSTRPVAIMNRAWIAVVRRYAIAIAQDHAKRTAAWRGM